jgi:hypothetical protein
MNHSDAPEKMAAFIRKVQERLAGVPACGDQIKFEHWQDMLESLTDEARLIQHPTGMAVPEPRTLSSIEDLRLALQQLLDWGSGSRKRRIPKAEAEELVASYLAAQGNPNEATVAKVSQATGVSTGAISQTEAWKEFRSYREGSKATKSISPRTISLSDEVLYARADDSADRHDYQIEMTEAEEAEEVWEQILQSAESSTERARLAGMNDDERQMAIQQFRNESQRARAR